MNALGAIDLPGLRARLAQLRKELTEATAAYREAAAQHDAASAIPVLRRRSQLMRALLEAQCELLLRFQSAEGASAPAAAKREATKQAVLV